MPDLKAPAVDPRYFEYCEEQHDSRTGSPFKSSGDRSYTRKWLVKVKDRALGANIVCTAPGVKPFSPYATEDGKEWDYQALCVDIRLEEPVDRLDGTHKYVVADYSTEMPAGGPPRFTAFGKDAPGSQNNPWEEPPHIEWDSEVHREARPKDLDGKPFVNKAFTPFKPAPTIEEGRAVLVYERNEKSHDARKQIRYAFSVNSDTFLGEAPGTVMLYPPKATLKWRGGISYWRMSYRFRFNTPEAPKPVNVQQSPSGVIIQAGNAVALGAAGVFAAPLKSWQPRILNCGLMQLQTSWALGPHFRRPVPIFRGGAGAVTEPVLLDEDGRELKPDPVTNVWPDPVYVEFRTYHALPFTPLLVAGIAFPG